ncbi:MAG: NADH-quinone oxidoreductase subunit L [Chloroflexi bacterium]|nr:NADH-quinone oxidoreductase subunit L [Chloroflexota bacterium]MYE41138.1 NADH-quinone oxidoreductase subunit L [Chloroflexota bacterium]
MVTEAAVWAIFLLPLGSFVLIALVIRPFLNRWPLLAAVSTIGALTAATVLAVLTLRSVILGHTAVFNTWEWLSFGGATIEMGLLVDPLTAVMLVVVTSISLLIQIYSVGYMQGDPGFARYFAYMSLFTASMLGLTLSSNIIQLYAFWELVGVSSYLLIGFWHDRPSAAAAAKKAFIITRIGDVGFLIAILYLFFKADDFAAAGLNAFHIPDIWQAAQPLAAGGAILAGASLTWMALGIFAGAVGKSGQFPLHAWLPDAMEGPTPVSALIHAATMVAAGVFLVARFFPVFEQSDNAMAVVALVGAFTALMAATMGLVMNDIKRVMAYSTVSQLGYMMAALGLGAYAPAIFHLVTHAVFKALLFLGAGSVNHASGTFDMRYMGGLRRYMPATYLLVVIAALSLIGIVPLAGFWSKDEILLAAFDGNSHFADWINIVAFVGLLAGVVLTAFYTVRMVMMTFYGDFRGGVAQEQAELHPEAHGEDADTTAHGDAHDGEEDADSHHGRGGVHLAESPVVMVAPMVVLGLGAVVIGYVINPQWINFLTVPVHWVTGFVADGLHVSTGGEGHAELPKFNWAIAGISTAAAVGGSLLGLLVYGLRRDRSREPLQLLGPVYTLLSQKYYVDALYEGIIVRRSFYRVVAGLTNWLDRRIVDGFVDLVGWLFRNIGSAIGRLQTGQAQTYATVVALGSLLIVLGFLLA